MVPQRKALLDTRSSVTRAFRIPNPQPDGSVELMRVYFIVGLYEDGRPGEIFVKADRQGSLAAGALDAVAITMSIGLQYGIPLRVLTDKLRGMAFDPSGYTRDGDIPSCRSILDLLARWLDMKFPEAPPAG